MLPANAFFRLASFTYLTFEHILKQTFYLGMVGYTESLTDPSYEGQILVLTYPLIGNYGVPERPSKTTLDLLPEEFESSRIHISALIVGYYSEDFSHFLSKSSLGAWLKENGIPALYGIDTRALTKKIREKGSMLGKVLARLGGPRLVRPNTHEFLQHPIILPSVPPTPYPWQEEYMDIPFLDPNQINLVARVSISAPIVHKPTSKARLHPSGRPLRVMAVDVGMKYNQIRCFTARGVELKVVPWDYDFNTELEPYDGLFLSNGPGDPATVKPTVDRLSKAIEKADRPIFGICLGHQLLSIALGAKTYKLKFGHRGGNQPVKDLLTGKVEITCQNHGFAIDGGMVICANHVIYEQYFYEFL